MYNSTRKVTPLKQKKRVTPNSNQRRKTVNSINNKKPKTDVSMITNLASKRKKIPGWLKSFKILENSSFLLATGLIIATMGIYSWTVLTQQTWSKQYRNLESLQRQERDFTVTTETIKNQLAEETELKQTELIPATPEQSIFLESSGNTTLTTETKELKQPNLKPVKLPLGY
jgi:hypothetical protein